MVTKLPRWVEVGGFSLTLIAGSVNAIGLLGFEHQAVSHLTGTSTLLGVRLTEGNWDSVLHLALIASFILGGSLGAVTYRRYNYAALSVPAVLALLLALIYWVYWFWVKQTERRSTNQSLE